MAIARVVAIDPSISVRNGLGRDGRQPVTGETLELVFRAQTGDSVQATTSDGVPLELAGMAALGSQLEAGDVLLVKVLATTPRLELALFEAPTAREAAGERPAAPLASPAPAFETEQSAMRQDQVAWLRQVAWPTPDPAALAISWRTTLVAELERRAGLRDDAASPPADPHAGAPAVEVDAVAVQRLQPLPGAEPWQLATCSWRRLRVTLGVQAVDDDAGSATPPSERSLCLRMDVTLPGLGEVCVALHLAGRGVMLDLVAEREETMQALRNRLAALVAAMARADLRVVRCRLMHALPTRAAPRAGVQVAAGRSASTVQTLRHKAQIDRTLPPALFRAAAELLVALA